MLKMIKKLFKKDLVNNDKGSALSVALIVIVILTFSLATITSMSVSLAGATTLKLGQVNEDSIAQGLIRQSIAEYELFINTTGSYTNFDNVEIPRILADYGVIVTNVTGTGEFIDYGVFGSIDSRVYRFAYEMTDGDVMVKYSFVSNYGSSVQTLEPFEYSMATTGQLILNGGLYNNVNLYGDEVLLADRAPYVYNNVQLLSPEQMPAYPQLGLSTIFQKNGYKYCIDGCFNLTLSPYEIVAANYVDVIGSPLVDKGILSPLYINDFFGNFVLDDYIFEYLKIKAPTGVLELSEQLTHVNLVDVIRDNLGSLTDGLNPKPTGTPAAFYDITGHPAFDFENDKRERINGFAAFWDGDLNLYSGITQDFKDEAFIVNGNLTINVPEIRVQGKIKPIIFHGSFVVLGDLILQGKSVDITGSFIVMGNTYINFDDGSGMDVSFRNMGLTILSRGDVFFNRITSLDKSSISAFVYSNESIYVDAVYSTLNIEGALFSRGRGIVVNSIKGKINPNNGNFSNSQTHNFIISPLNKANYLNKFINIPFIESLITFEGIYTFGTSEWSLE